MPRDKGFGDKKKKMKAATEVAVEVEASGDVAVSIVVSPRPKRTRQSRRQVAGPRRPDALAATSLYNLCRC